MRVAPIRLQALSRLRGLFISLSSLQSLETEAENTSELGVVVSSSSSGDTSRELQVTWQQPLHFLIRTRQAEGGRKRGEGGSASANPLQYLQKEGILRFIIRRGDDAWPAFSAQFPLSSLTCSVAQLC